MVIGISGKGSGKCLADVRLVRVHSGTLAQATILGAPTI